MVMVEITFFEWSPPWHSIPTYHLEKIYIYILDICIYIYMNFYLFRHSIFHSFWHILWHYFLAFYLASVLTYFLAYMLTFFLASILTFFLTCYLASILTFFLALCLASIWHLFWHSFWHGHSRTSNASARFQWTMQVEHRYLEPADEVRQCQLRSGTRSWGPAVPIEIWSSLGEGGRW